MKLIKNMIEKNKLKHELRQIDEALKQGGYYEEIEKLNKLIYQPDNYAGQLFKIKRKFCPLLSRKEYIEKKINQLSGNKTTDTSKKELTK